MSDPNQEGENSIDNEQPNTSKGKYFYQDKPNENLEEITDEDIRNAKKNKRILKVMEILMQDEK